MTMRYLCFLMAAFFLVLDLGICDDGIQVKLPGTSVMSTLQKEKQAADQDQCPPSCSCSCCCILSLIQFNTTSLPRLTPTTQVYHNAMMEAPVYRAINIWQPPKLSTRA